MSNDNAKIKALVLLSGGLDSMLAVKILQVQGIEVEGVCFESNFFTADRARSAAVQLGVPLHVVDISEELLEIVKNPPSGYGKNMNPCIDCHAFMIRQAAKLMRSDGFDLIATGEVLGQRPFSQNREALDRVARLAEIEVLRPLSAKLLEETRYEKDGLVNRGRLLDVSGRQRERQMELADRYKIKDYPSPAGGCLLTDPEISVRLNNLLQNWPECRINDVEIMKNGRVFWFSSGNSQSKALLMVSRNEIEGNNLAALAQTGDIMLELKEMNGPLGLLRGLDENINIREISSDIPKILRIEPSVTQDYQSYERLLGLCGIIVGYYSPKARGREAKLVITIK